MKGKSPFFLPPSPETPFSPPPARHLLRSPEQEFYLADATPFEERELLDVCSFVETDDLVEVVRIVDTPKPFSGFGSYEQRHGDAIYPRRSGGSRFSAEAPAKLGCGNATDNNSKAKIGFSSNPIDIHSSECSEATPHRRLGKQHSFPVDIDREEAWERKRELYVMDECCSRGPSDVGGAGRTVTRSVSDCGERAWPSEKPLMRSRTRSLTDEDLEELRGCIDLGFGFSSSEDCDLSGTLPALELYYAINRQYNDIKSRMSPDSPLQRGSLYRTSSDDIPSSPLSDSWRISSPGDHPSQVKTRLRHWAQAVACSVKQGFSL